MNSNAELSMIAELDLDCIKVKLMHQESGEGWTLARANAIEFEYRRFLCLMKLFPHEHTAPLFDVDIFWHYHILDTMKYAVDCEQIFGYFLHHFPYAGLRGEDDEAAHQRVGVRMQELYEATFGEAYIRESNDGAAPAAAALATAWSVAASPLTAGSAAATAKTAWSVAASPLTAAAAAGSAKMAWSVAASPITAGAVAGGKTAWSVAASPLAVGPCAAAPRTAWSVAAVKNDPFYSVRPALPKAA